MAYPRFSAGDVMDISAALLNDPAKAIFSYAAQIPYLTVAVQELEEHFEQNNLPVTNETSTVIPVDAGVTLIGFADDAPAPNLPDDLIDIRRLWYSQRDQDLWLPMTKREYLPHYLSSTAVGALTIYTWNNQEVKFQASSLDNDVKMDYVKPVFPAIVDENTILSLINGKTFLEYRTAALVARFVGENATRATELDGFAVFGSDRATSIANKGKQSIPARRRPFRAAWRRRG